MSGIRVLVLRAAGTNCDEETAYAWSLAGATPERVHVRRLIEAPRVLDEYAILTIPGGFSYGDDISAGKILASQLVNRLAEQLARFVEAGKLVLGICNGFQVLVKAGLLPGPLNGQASDGDRRQLVTLAANESARFEARWVQLKVASRRCVFLPAGESLALPIAHGEGKLVAKDEETLAQLGTRGRIALRYTDEHGLPSGYPANPNGSQDDIAGLTDDSGRILGLMPHPERFVEPTQHPTWTRRGRDARADGRLVFEYAVQAAR